MKIDLNPQTHIHFVGIGGSGLSAIAKVLLERGHIVSGSDKEENDRSEELREIGATIYIGHRPEQIDGANFLLVSSAIRESNPEIVEARLRGIPVLKRSDFLATLMGNTIGIAVAGTHGKTTTTSMLASILIKGNLDPTIIVGGVLPLIGSNARSGKGDYFLIEADEYDYMFLGLTPEVAIINNLEHDHPDIFTDMAQYREAFRQFALRLPTDGRLVVNGDDKELMELVNGLSADFEIYTYGLQKNSTLRAEQIRPNPQGGCDFVALEEDELIGIVRLRVPGEHNVRNALAAIAVALDLGVSFYDIRNALAEFGGIGRRFQEIGNVGDVTIIDDYAHHPTEIKVTLAAARQRYPQRNIWAVWQPHTYSRVKLLFDEFTQSFKDADKVILLDIYASRETDTLGITAEQLHHALEQHHSYVRLTPTIEEAADYILDRIRPGDVVLTLGAGDGNRVGQLVLSALQRRVNSH